MGHMTIIFREGNDLKMEVDGEANVAPIAILQAVESETHSVVKKTKKKKNKGNAKKNVEGEKADYAGLEVKAGATGKLQKPRHSGAKVRARDKGTLVLFSSLIPFIYSVSHGKGNCFF